MKSNLTDQNYTNEEYPQDVADEIEKRLKSKQITEAVVCRNGTFRMEEIKFSSRDGGNIWVKIWVKKTQRWSTKAHQMAWRGIKYG